MPPSQEKVVVSADKGNLETPNLLEDTRQVSVWTYLKKEYLLSEEHSVRVLLRLAIHRELPSAPTVTYRELTIAIKKDGPRREPPTTERCSVHQLPGQCYFHGVAILAEDVEPGFRHVSRRTL